MTIGKGTHQEECLARNASCAVFVGVTRFFRAVSYHWHRRNDQLLAPKKQAPKQTNATGLASAPRRTGREAAARRIRKACLGGRLFHVPSIRKLGIRKLRTVDSKFLGNSLALEFEPVAAHARIR